MKITMLIPLLLSTSVFASESELKSEIEKLKQQNQSIELQLKELQKPATAAPAASDVVVGGYGEISYNAYSNKSSRSRMDLRRFVLSLTKHFNEKWSFNGEVEWEHAVTSSSDQGESAIEQAYLNYQINPDMNLKAGLFLMPFGLLNESHEPPVYDGVERNEVETRIIPATWREGGVGISGTAANSLEWGAGIVTSFDIAKFDNEGKPLAAIHQELQFAKARDLGIYGTLNYKTPGLLIGASVFSGDTGQGNADYLANATLPDFSGVNARVTLADLHARWQQNAWDVHALIAKGTQADANKLNQVLLAYNIANAKTLPYVASEFYGWLVQAAYSIQVGPEATLAPFARLEAYDTQAKMPTGFTASAANTQHLFTGGLSYKPVAQIVFKTDYQNYNDDSTQNRFNLGLGYMF